MKPRTDRMEPVFSQLTSEPGEELHPSLSPDGEWIVYASKASGNWDIYQRRVGGQTFFNLTKDSSAADTHPAFSPDGKKIAFRSERDDGGIFVMGATGESVRRLTDFGYFPAWSPDGLSLACSTDLFEDPEALSQAGSELWVVDVATGEKRLVSEEAARQPQWSPNGHRIAYWSSRGGVRDIWTIGGWWIRGPGDRGSVYRLESRVVAGRKVSLLFQRPGRNVQHLARADRRSIGQDPGPGRARHGRRGKRRAVAFDRS